MKRRKIVIVLFFLFNLLISKSEILPLTIKIGSIAPDRSPWNNSLRDIGRELSKITKGKVRLKIYPGGRVGNELDMIKMMRKGKLGGAVLTGSGITNLYKDFFVLNIPLLITSEGEFRCVFNKMKPVFEKGIEDQGFKVITWSLNGWLYFFSKRPVFYPKDLKRHKIAFSTSLPEIGRAWEKAGYKIEFIDFRDLKISLQEGMAEAFLTHPIVIALGQHFNFATNLSSLKIAPLIGGMVLSEKTWKSIPDQYKTDMIRIAQNLSKVLFDEVIQLEKNAIKAMEDEDLIVNRLPADALKKWRNAADEVIDPLIGKVFSREVYDLVQKYLKEYRELEKNKNPE